MPIFSPIAETNFHQFINLMNFHNTLVKKSWAIWSYKCLAVTKDSCALELKKKNRAKEYLKTRIRIPASLQSNPLHNCREHSGIFFKFIHIFSLIMLINSLKSPVSLARKILFSVFSQTGSLRLEADKWFF